ncbi:YbgA family protein [Hydrogenobaculum sp.]
MKQLVKPNILVSSCFFEACRYNGAFISDDFVKSLSNFVNVIKVCPEVAIGLGVPRDPILIQKKGDNLRLIQPSTGIDVSQKMIEFSKNFVKDLDIDGAILKSKSPSCGVYSAKYFHENGQSLGKGPGFFAKELLEAFPDYPIEEEKRLLDEDIRYDFLTKIFAISDLKNTFKNMKDYSELIDFHTRYKFTLMYYNQNIMRFLGKLVASSRNEDFDVVKDTYKKHFLKALNSKKRKISHINVLEHIFGYFSRKISSAERRHFMEVLKLFKEDKVDLFVPLYMLKAFAIRFDEEYILKQAYLEPFPKELI